MLPLRPILSTLSRHRTAALLIVAEIALTCAIVCNAVFLIVTRLEHVRLPSGAAEEELVYLGSRSVGHGRNTEAVTREDLAALRALPGVRSAAIASVIPFGPSMWMSGVNLAPGQSVATVHAAMYTGSASLVDTLGLKLVEGRGFRADEIADSSAVDRSANYPYAGAIITRALAHRLFPAGAVGRSVYVFDDAPLPIVGVVDRLQVPQPVHGDESDLYSLILPEQPAFDDGVYVLRTEPGRRAAVLKAAVAALERVDPRRVAEAHGTLEDLRGEFHQADLSMVRLLAGVCVALLVVTAFGIVGLASFWVQQRTRMIGTRRALGATRAQIRHYFQLENLLLTTAGIALGMLGAYAINQWLMARYELARLPAAYLPVGALVLWVLGQVAVLAPARRAAALPPAHAMRGLA